VNQKQYFSFISGILYIHVVRTKQSWLQRKPSGTQTVGGQQCLDPLFRLCSPKVTSFSTKEKVSQLADTVCLAGLALQRVRLILVVRVGALVVWMSTVAPHVAGNS
jgi:hypothetical protein